MKIQVEVQKDSFKDVENYNKPLKVIRNGEEINVIQKLLRKGDKYETSLERAEYLEKVGAVKRVSNQKMDSINESE